MCEVSVKLLSVKLLYVKFVCVKLVCVKVLYVKLLYVKFVCEIIVVVCVREAAGGEGARDTESKTRTPHKVVGKKQWRTFHEQDSVPKPRIRALCQSRSVFQSATRA